MYYYEVLVGTMSYHGGEALTYAAAEQLRPGQVVRVPLRARSTLGIVVRGVPKPSFDVKPLSAAAPYPPVPAVNLELLRWLYAYYPAPLGAVVRLFVPPSEVFPKPADVQPSTAVPKPKPLPPLTTDQTNALSAVQATGTHLLHGITGSGKSRVYIELAARTLAAGKSSLILTPEIGLTAQLTRTFTDVFGDIVYVLHSQLTAAQRRDIWYTLLTANQPVIVIGPRSALFSPLHEVGLIVLDESHDNAYKNESAPHYQAGRVAAKLAELHGAALVLGSATPAVEDYYLAGARGRPIIGMQRLAKVGDETPLVIRMADMRRRENFARSPLLSDQLVAAVALALERGEQSLLYLNRRGTANAVLCSACGWQALCPNCDLSLTYHGDAHELRCHVCGHHEPAPTSCPVCGNTDVVFKSVGTKAVVDAVHKLFPAARVQRFDTDAKKAERLEHHVGALADGSADIIVGTQMVGKGLDLPRLAAVGIINADSSLVIPDYTAAEQTYQLISQVVGRVGRGHRAGTVVVQTYDPENTTLLAAVHRQWQAFYDAELTERRAYKFPPFTYLLKLRVLRATAKSAEQAAAKLAAELAQTHKGLTIEGPAPSFHPRERGKYSWQLLLKSASRTTLVTIIKTLPSGWSYDIDPINLL
ncbi:MAG TPA: primosomal protein N' [Candidatus Saccharimonadales bacterium]|nr:primosomal protein N' [Candidatus Saccharimonadales bacterium]